MHSTTNVPSYNNTERIAHHCHNSALHMYKDTTTRIQNPRITVQPKEIIATNDKVHAVTSRFNPTYHSTIFEPEKQVVETAQSARTNKTAQSARTNKTAQSTRTHKTEVESARTNNTVTSSKRSYHRRHDSDFAAGERKFISPENPIPKMKARKRIEPPFLTQSYVDILHNPTTILHFEPTITDELQKIPKMQTKARVPTYIHKSDKEVLQFDPKKHEKQRNPEQYYDKNKFGQTSVLEIQESTIPENYRKTQKQEDQKVKDYYEKIGSATKDPEGKILATIQVQSANQNIDISDFQKKLNSEGHFVVGEKFEKYPHNEVRAETGTIQVRVSNEKEVQDLIEKMGTTGISAKVAEKRKQIWKI